MDRGALDELERTFWQEENMDTSLAFRKRLKLLRRLKILNVARGLRLASSVLAESKLPRTSSVGTRQSPFCRI